MNNFAIETVQSLFENMLAVPQSELGTTVMRFREEVKNLGEPERFAVTGDLVLRVQELAWDLGNRFHLDYCTTLDELEFNLLDFESQMTEKEKRVFDWFMFFQYPWPNGAPNCVLFLVNCFDGKLFFMLPDIILGENKMEDLNHMIVMLKALFEHVSFQDFQKVALPLHRDAECCLHALLDGDFPPCLSPMQDIDEMAGKVSRPHPDAFIDALFRLHYTLKGMYLEGNLNEYRPF